MRNRCNIMQHKISNNTIKIIIGKIPLILARQSITFITLSAILSIRFALELSSLHRSALFFTASIHGSVIHSTENRWRSSLTVDKSLYVIEYFPPGILDQFPVYFCNRIGDVYITFTMSHSLSCRTSYAYALSVRSNQVFNLHYSPYDFGNSPCRAFLRDFTTDTGYPIITD